MSTHKSTKRADKDRTVSFKRIRRDKHILAKIEQRAFNARLGHEL